MQQQPMIEEETMASDQEQQMLEDAFDLALEMIHGDGQSGDTIAQTVLQAEDVSKGIGDATATVLIGVDKRAGGLPDDLKMALAQEIIGELAGLAVEAGALSEDEIDDGFIDAVVSHAYSHYLEIKEQMGELDPAELEASVSEAEQVMGASARQPQQPQPMGLMG